jgi:hypothetical protein
MTPMSDILSHCYNIILLIYIQAGLVINNYSDSKMQKKGNEYNAYVNLNRQKYD